MQSRENDNKQINGIKKEYTSDEITQKINPAIFQLQNSFESTEYMANIFQISDSLNTVITPTLAKLEYVNNFSKSLSDTMAPSIIQFSKTVDQVLPSTLAKLEYLNDFSKSLSDTMAPSIIQFSKTVDQVLPPTLAKLEYVNNFSKSLYDAMAPSLIQLNQALKLSESKINSFYSSESFKHFIAIQNKHMAHISKIINENFAPHNNRTDDLSKTLKMITPDLETIYTDILKNDSTFDNQKDSISIDDFSKTTYSDLIYEIEKIANADLSDENRIKIAKELDNVNTTTHIHIHINNQSKELPDTNNETNESSKPIKKDILSFLTDPNWQKEQLASKLMEYFSSVVLFFINLLIQDKIDIVTLAVLINMLMKFIKLFNDKNTK